MRSVIKIIMNNNIDIKSSVVFSNIDLKQISKEIMDISPTPYYVDSSRFFENIHNILKVLHSKYHNMLLFKFMNRHTNSPEDHKKFKELQKSVNLIVKNTRKLHMEQVSSLLDFYDYELFSCVVPKGYKVDLVISKK